MGQNRIETPSPKKLENLRPDHLLEALLIRPADPASEQPIMESWSDGGEAGYLVHIVRRGGNDRLLLARKVWFDRGSLEIVRQQVFDAAGEVVTDARYAGWDKRSGVELPNNIRIMRPKDGYELNIVFRRVAVNQALGDDRFQLTPPEGVKVERVGGGGG